MLVEGRGRISIDVLGAFGCLGTVNVYPGHKVVWWLSLSDWVLCIFVAFHLVLGRIRGLLPTLLILGRLVATWSGSQIVPTLTTFSWIAWIGGLILGIRERLLDFDEDLECLVVLGPNLGRDNFAPGARPTQALVTIFGESLACRACDGHIESVSSRHLGSRVLLIRTVLQKVLGFLATVGRDESW